MTVGCTVENFELVLLNQQGASGENKMPSQSRHCLVAPYFFLAHRNCAAQGDLERWMLPRSCNLWVYSLTLKPYRGEKRLSFSATGAHSSSMRGRERSPSMYAGTHFLGSVGNSPPVTEWRSKSFKRSLCFMPSCPQMAPSTRTCLCGSCSGKRCLGV